MRNVTVIPWTNEERAQLRQLWENGLPRRAIAALLGRSLHSIATQVHYLRLRPRTTEQQPGDDSRKRIRGPTLPPLPSLRGE